MSTRKSSLKNIVYVTILIVSLLVTIFQLGVWYAHSQAISNPGTTYGPGDVDAYSYIIFKEGSTYYAKNGATRVIDYSGTDALTVVQTAVDVLAAGNGGIVYLKGFQKPPGLSLASIVLVIEEYLGKLKYYGLTTFGTSYGSGDVDVYSYIIFRDGTTYFAKNGLTRAIDYFGTNASLVIQNSLNGLTPLRSYQEIVTIKGNIILDSPILIPSWTFLDLTEATLKVKDNAKAMNEGLVSVMDAIHVTISGGVLDGNRQNQVNNQVGIVFNTTTYTEDSKHIVENVFIKWFTGDGLYIGDNERELNAKALMLYGNGGNGIYIKYTSGNHKFVNIVSAQNGKNGYYVAGDSSQFVNCGAFGNGENKVAAEADGFYIQGDNNQFVGCTSGENYRNGYAVFGSGTSVNTFVGSIATENGFYFNLTGGFVIDGADRTTIMGGWSGNTGIGVGYHQDYGIKITGEAQYMFVFGMKLYQNDVGSLFNDATGVKNIILFNEGYVTQNSGSATITAGQTSTTVNHGLHVTPARVILTPVTDTGGKRYWISAKTSSTFTITIDSIYASDISFDWFATVDLA